MKNVLESTEVTGPELTANQFLDVCKYVWSCGEFLGPSGLTGDAFEGLDVIDEPTEEPEALKLYLRNRWPVAVYEFDIGYTVIRRES